MESTEMLMEVIESTEALSGLAETTEVITEYTEVIVPSCEHCDTIIGYLDANNGLLFRLIQSWEFFLALAVAVVFCSVCYIYLKNFTRF